LIGSGAKWLHSLHNIAGHGLHLFRACLVSLDERAPRRREGGQCRPFLDEHAFCGSHSLHQPDEPGPVLLAAGVLFSQNALYPYCQYCQKGLLSVLAVHYQCAFA